MGRDKILSQQDVGFAWCRCMRGSWLGCLSFVLDQSEGSEQQAKGLVQETVVSLHSSMHSAIHRNDAEVPS